MQVSENVYQKLRAEIDKLPIPYPATSSGTELRLLKHLFTPEEAEIAVHLNILPETVKRIHTRLKKNGIDIEAVKLESILEGLVLKGAIVTDQFAEKRQGKAKRYSLVPLVIGMFEFQVDRITGDYTRDFIKYFDDTFSQILLEQKTLQMRTIPVGASLSPGMNIADYNNIRKYVTGLKDKIAVMNCVCRQSYDQTGSPCKHSAIRETCLAFHDAARFIRGRGVGRWITKDETHALLDNAEKEKFVLQPENAREPQFLCVCCPDCCHALKLIRLSPNPSEFMHAPYRASIDTASCKGCKKCITACAMDAISMKDKHAVVDPVRCIGCGLCSTACKNDAHSMVLTGRSYVPPKNEPAMYQKIMMDRFGFMGTMKAVSRAITGRKV